MLKQFVFPMLCGAVFAFPAAAHAAAPCSMPPALQQRVCDDPDLRALDTMLIAKERAVQAVTARPATWAARAAEFRRWTATETDVDGKLIGKEALTERFRSRLEALDSELATARGVRPATAATAIGDTCLAGWLHMGCTVPASGILRGAGGVRILWQLQSGASEIDGVGMGVMLWDASAHGAPKPIGWTFEGADMQPPRYNPELRLLWVPGRMRGTGDGNADLLYQKQGNRWVEIETESWREALDKRLPAGLGAWHGVDYDFGGLGADTDLWKPDDANCCATGGRAHLGFKIEGSSLRLDTIEVQAGGPDKEWKTY